MKNSLSRNVSVIAGVLALSFLGSCGTEATEGIHGPWTVDEETLGDTLVVRTVSGSVWGDTMVLVPELAIGEMDGEDPYVFGSVASLDVDSEGRIYALDRQAQEVRVFSPQGEFLFTMGGPGEGPGEFLQPNHIQIADGGDLLVRDGRWRFSRFSKDGDLIDTWPILSGYGTSRPFFLQPDGSVLNPSVPRGLVRYERDGTPVDTLDLPSADFDPNYLEVTNSNSHAYYSRPFSPSAQWTMTRGGEVLFGITGAYRIERWEPGGGAFRIERMVDPVPVDPAERSRAKETTTESLRGTNPSWNWYGPDVPTVKPPWINLLAGTDGSIWVIRSMEAREVDNPQWDARAPDEGHPTRWVSPQVADVFDAEGRYMGPINLPDDFSFYPPPLVSIDRVWAQAFHEMGYPQVVRYGVVEGTGG